MLFTCRIQLRLCYFLIMPLQTTNHAHNEYECKQKIVFKKNNDLPVIPIWKRYIKDMRSYDLYYLINLVTFIIFSFYCTVIF